jgi:tRNA-dihydrouridine synthase 3
MTSLTFYSAQPWIFTELKERRDWDISSRERLDMVGKLTEYGLEHWGSDIMGVNTTRRFVCEALSFQHRYVPVGLLEHLPIQMNDRAYPYKGRDSLEVDHYFMLSRSRRSKLIF